MAQTLTPTFQGSKGGFRYFGGTFSVAAGDNTLTFPCGAPLEYSIRFDGYEPHLSVKDFGSTVDPNQTTFTFEDLPFAMTGTFMIKTRG